MNKYEELKARLGEVEKGVLLSEHTTFAIGGVADYFFEAKTNQSVLLAIKTARELKLPYFILGGGSNLLVRDSGFGGLVIKIATSKCEANGESLICSAGTKIQRAIAIAMKNDLTGVEFLSGIPGTIGGAVICNARAHFLGNFLKKPICIADIINSLMVANEKGEVFELKGDKIAHTLAYSSIRDMNLIILEAKLKLRKGVSQLATKYVNDYKNFRKDKPYSEFPTPGSIFQNPEGQSAGQLIDSCGLRGKRFGKAEISSRHANFIVNLGGAKASDVLELIKQAMERVKKQCGIDLKEEITII